MFSQPFLPGTMNKHEVILEQETVLPEGLSMENAISVLYVISIWKTMYASV